MEGSADDIGAPLDSRELVNLDTSMSRLKLNSKKDTSCNAPSLSSSTSPPELVDVSASSSGSDSSFGSASLFSSTSASPGGVSENLINSVDQFLREALQKPRERLSVLRMEQDVEKFIQDHTQEQMEFQQLPTSYLRLAAHRVALHYSLQSMVLLDNSLPDGSGSRIIVRKTSDSRLPLIRLADIPVDLPTEDSGVTKVAIKQRPQKWSQIIDNMNSHSLKTNNSKSMEERKEEYNKARARIFDSNSSSSSGVAVEKSESEPKMQERFRHGSLGILKIEEKSLPGGSDMNTGRSLVDFSTGSSRSARGRTEKEPVGRFKTNSRVAIFRDHEFDRKDPDYDRSYDRYMQRFDSGFGFNGGPYILQPMFSPALNYNTEFPQLGSVHRPRSSSEHQPRPFPQHLPGPWAAASAPAGIGYGHPETMMAPFGPNHVGAHSTSALFLQSPHYPCQCPGMPFLHSHEQVHQPFPQFRQQQPDASFGLARPR